EVSRRPVAGHLIKKVMTNLVGLGQEGTSSPGQPERDPSLAGGVRPLLEESLPGRLLDEPGSSRGVDRQTLGDIAHEGPGKIGRSLHRSEHSECPGRHRNSQRVHIPFPVTGTLEQPLDMSQEFVERVKVIIPSHSYLIVSNN